MLQSKRTRSCTFIPLFAWGLLTASLHAEEFDVLSWAKSPLKLPSVPPVKWVKGENKTHPVDAFIKKTLEDKNLAPSPQAEARTLIRRLSFDLRGLPPEPSDVESFLKDPSPQAYEALVDKYLNSPQYGERWARHWLDLVRYAETDGYREDKFRPQAYRYRDYVIQAFNRDKPFDQFVQEQLAGDELWPESLEALAATGFYRLGVYEFNQSDVRGQWEFILDDLTDLTGDVFLGLATGCARCHDHKFDPLSQKDYYRLKAFYSAIIPREDRSFWSKAEKQRQIAWENKTKAIREKIEIARKAAVRNEKHRKIARFPEDIQAMIHKPVKERSPYEHQLAELAYRQVTRGLEEQYNKPKGPNKDEWARLLTELKKFAKDKPQPKWALTITDVGPQAPEVHIPGKSDPDLDLSPAFPSALTGASPKILSPRKTPRSTGRRTALAKWLTSSENSLVFRVWVNRLWQYHFGQGIVATSSDFGKLGTPPSHPELLDWLTFKFIEGGMRMKPLHKLMVTSKAYKQSSLVEPQSKSALQDPQGKWLSRRRITRLESEQIRDAMLATSGELQLKVLGPSVEASTSRRSIYVKVKRNSQPAILGSFDCPDGFDSIAKRNVTTTAPQALYLLNGDWPFQRAKAFKKRVDTLTQKQIEKDPQSSVRNLWIEQAYRLAFNRKPTVKEIQRAITFIKPTEGELISTQKDKKPSTISSKEHENRIDFCHVLLNTNEFLYID